MHCRVHGLVEDFATVLGHEIDRLIASKTPAMAPRMAASFDYCFRAPGKCLRSFLASTAAKTLGGTAEKTLPLCVAIEAVHTYSLVHDDLPSMDNAATRRRRPSCHKEFDEALALLTGDALLTLAFEVLSQMQTDATVRCEIIGLIAEACGCCGMISGQVLDMEGEQFHTRDSVLRIHGMKTARLFSASCEAGAILAYASSEERKILASYGEALGYAFQAKDDLSDVDDDNTSPNLAKVLGREETIKHIDRMLYMSGAKLSSLQHDVTLLHEFISFVGDLRL